MTGHEWKPGDVAAITYGGGEFEDTALRCDPDGWEVAAGHVIDRSVAAIRPLVVIDPEDREQVERLARLLHDYDAHLTDDPHRESAWVSLAADALREFANPTPPKPDEPTALGAVVRDSHRYWVRNTPDAEGRTWRSRAGQWATYADIDAVEVLSEGVPS